MSDLVGNPEDWFSRDEAYKHQTEGKGLDSTVVKQLLVTGYRNLTGSVQVCQFCLGSPVSYTMQDSI